MKFDLQLFLPFGPFQFSNEVAENEFSVIMNAFIKDENNQITSIEGKDYKFEKFWIDYYYLNKFFQVNILKINSFLEMNLLKSPEKTAFLEYNTYLFSVEEHKINKSSNSLGYLNDNSEKAAKLARAKTWIKQKYKELAKTDTVDEKLQDETSSEEWAADITCLIFVLLGWKGIIRKFGNASELARIIEKLTRHKAVKLYPFLRINSQNEFTGRPAAKKKIDLLISTLEDIINFLKNEREKLD